MLPAGRCSFGFASEFNSTMWNEIQNKKMSPVNPAESAQVKLEQNMAAAEKAIKEVRSYLTVGSNTEKACKDEDFWKFAKLNATIRENMKYLKQLHIECYGKHPDFETFATWCREDLKMYGYGHCGEIANAVFMTLKDNGVYPLTYCVANVGKHAVVVIGEGENAVVADAWADKFYALSQFEEMQRPENEVRYPRKYHVLQNPPPYLAGTLVEIWHCRAAGEPVNSVNPEFS